MFDHVMETGEATWSDDQLLPLKRYGYTEECYFYYSYSPVRATDSGEVEGIFTAVTETTYRVLAERRERLLRQISEATSVTQSAPQACQVALLKLSEVPEEAPFCVAYLYEDDGSTLAEVSAIGVVDRELAPRRFDTSVVNPRPMPLHGVEKIQVDFKRFPQLPGTPWPEPLVELAVIAIENPAGLKPFGYLLAGVSPRRRFDANYSMLFSRIAGHIATAIINAQAYEAEKRRAEQLAAIDEAKTVFFSNASHEFRTPLTLMLSPVQAILDREADQTMLHVERSELEMVARNGQRLLRLVNTLLDFSRIEAGRARSTQIPLDISSATADMASAFRSTIEAAGLEYNVACPTLSHPVSMDPEMWEKVVLNLISNAFKYTLVGGISVSVKAEEDVASIQITDTGVGIPSGDLPRVFERFHRVKDQSGRTFEGTGIGLALVKELVELHNGFVSVESKVGEGTIFTIKLPFCTELEKTDAVTHTLDGITSKRAESFISEARRWIPAEISDSGQGNVEAPAAVRSVNEFRGQVLLVDDNADMRDYVRRLLEDMGHTVHVAADGLDALERLTDESPDLIVTDVMMPRVDGFELVKRIRKTPSLSHIPIIMLSARAGEDEAAIGLNAGADEYLVKPFTAKDLRARVDAMLKRNEHRNQVARKLVDSNNELGETVLQRTRERDQAWNLSHDLFGIANYDGIWVSINPSWTRLLGWKETDILGRTSEWMEHPDDIRKTREEIVALSTGTASYSFENRYRTADGTYRTLSWTAVPKEELLYCVARDVTDERLREDEAMRARERSMQSQKMEAVGQLTGGVAHDFNNVLQVIGGNLQIIRQQTVDAQVLKRVDVAYSAVERGGKLASQLLSFARRHPIEPVVVNLRRLIDGMDELLSHAVGEAITLRIESPPDLLNNRVDRAHVENAILNLSLNSRDAMDGSGRLTITLKNTHVPTDEEIPVDPGAYVRLTVTDTGCGMSEEVRARIFEPFFSTKPEGRGTGLGMSMVYGFTKQAGGYVDVVSDLGKGTSISLYLPAVPDDETPLKVTTNDAPKGAGQVVLVVEDNPSVQQTVTEMLRMLNYQTVTADSADDAVDVLNSRSDIDILFTDVVMPGTMKSEELAKLVSQSFPHIAILFTSGYAENRLTRGGLVDSGLRLLSKPYTQIALARCLHETLFHHHGATKLSTRNRRSPVVILVEDDENLREATSVLLSDYDLDIHEASTGLGGVRLIEAVSADVLVTDVNLPDMTGVELAVQARRLMPHISVLFVTGEGAQEYANAVPNASSIQKPFTVEDLEREITHLMETQYLNTVKSN
ncbi:response regulator [Robbsia sp. KACC 23696]|uniref:response regulator n=1 Tax=Robbsia sp. KACC 23696 TaxID=3149231 RepID=UPI00325B67D7